MLPRVKVSVIIPTFNRPKELSRCLRALREQALLPDEVIVVNDGGKRVDFKVENFVFKAFFLKRGKGQVWAKNLGAEKARGEILVFIDDDCVPERDWLQRLVRIFKYEEIAVVFGRIRERKTKSKKDTFSDIILNLPFYPLYLLIRKQQGGTIYPTGRVDSDLNTEKRGFCHWGGAGNMAIRKSCFEKVGGFDSRLLPGAALEEPDLAFRVDKVGGRIFYNGRARVAHYSSPPRRLNPEKEISNLRANEIYFGLKNLAPQSFFHFSLFLSYQIWQVLIYSLLSLASKRYWLRVQGKWAGFKHWRRIKRNENCD